MTMAPPAEKTYTRDGTLSIGVVMTGGTIAKSYYAAEAKLANFEPRVKDIIAGLRTDDLNFTYYDLMHRDSLDIGREERRHIVEAVMDMSRNHDGVLVTHGTDGMADTGGAIVDAIAHPRVPVILTGAMVPYTVRGSDAVQNVTESLLALRMLPPGAYIVFHNRILPLPGARKDHKSLTFSHA